MVPKTGATIPIPAAPGTGAGRKVVLAPLATLYGPVGRYARTNCAMLAGFAGRRKPGPPLRSTVRIPAPIFSILANRTEAVPLLQSPGPAAGLDDVIAAIAGTPVGHPVWLAAHQ
ncbi:MAG: hypothetical protein GDA36_12780 [Rhodobacteraceae bacterium]|nr:hypothetical protein [Paracoccaceae bacterium]